MASLEKRGEWYRLIFKYGGERFTHSLHTVNEKTAVALKGSIERTILQLQQRLLRVPDGADVKEFIVSGGQIAVPKAATQPAEPPATKPTPLTLEQVKTKYVETMSIGAIEENSLDTVKMHLRHFLRSLGADFPLQNLTQANLQEHIVKRSKDRGIRKRLLSPTTMRKEIASLRATWNWGVQAGLLTGSFPNKGLKFPKTTEKPPFQTYEQIQRQIAQGGLSDVERRELWDCLYLTLTEIDELLEHVRTTAIQPFLYPMFCFLAHTGARRSEMLRARIADVDLDGGTVRIHEKKRAHGKITSRRVPLSPFLAGVLRDWLAVHPGGPFLFCQQLRVFRSKKKRTETMPISRDEATDHFKRTLHGSKWAVMRGYHALRHTFCSLCASRGADLWLIPASVRL
jgi:integrase